MLLEKEGTFSNAVSLFLQILGRISGPHLLQLSILQSLENLKIYLKQEPVRRTVSVSDICCCKYKCYV